MKIKKTVKSQNKVRKKRLVLLSLLILVAVLPLLVFNHWANQPSSQQIIISNPPVTDAKPKFKIFKTEYFSVLVPTGWRISTEIDRNIPSRLHVLAYAAQGNSQAAITSDLLPSEGLSGIGDYILRATDTSRYIPVKADSLPVGSKFFKSTSGVAESTVFMTHGNRYLSLTTSGQDTPEESFSLLNKMSGSLKWVE